MGDGGMPVAAPFTARSRFATDARRGINRRKAAEQQGFA